MAKKHWFVYPRTTEVHENGMDTGKGHISFRGKPYIRTSDRALVDEIDTEYGLKSEKKDVYSFEDDRVAVNERNDRSEIHNYFFAGKMSLKDHPWKPSEDPEYECIGPGRYRKIPEIARAVREAGVKDNGKTDDKTTQVDEEKHVRSPEQEN